MSSLPGASIRCAILPANMCVGEGVKAPQWLYTQDEDAKTRLWEIGLQSLRRLDVQNPPLLSGDKKA
ncbi:hypothetical protein LOZ65_005950, partial [Ophidiomyces ophidiicola]